MFGDVVLPPLFQVKQVMPIVEVQDVKNEVRKEIKRLKVSKELIKGRLFFARPISLFVQSGFCSAPDREFYAL